MNHYRCHNCGIETPDGRCPRCNDYTIPEEPFPVEACNSSPPQVFDDGYPREPYPESFDYDEEFD